MYFVQLKLLCFLRKPYQFSSAPAQQKQKLSNPFIALCCIALSYALKKGFTSMVTSLDARCSNQLGGELKHRLFGIPCIQLETQRTADEALLKLTHDAKKQY